MNGTLLAGAAEYPVVTLLGPRQAGKTTLVRATFPEHEYCNLENPELRRLAREDPKQFFALRERKVILDEVQRVPELLSWIQVRVDEDKTKGQYILTGSHQLSLHEAVAQSLAGHQAISATCFSGNRPFTIPAPASTGCAPPSSAGSIFTPTGCRGCTARPTTTGSGSTLPVGRHVHGTRTPRNGFN